MTEKALLGWMDTTSTELIFSGFSSQSLSSFLTTTLLYTKIVKEALAKLNTKLIIIPGGLIPKPQIMDVLYNRPFKHCV